MTVPKTVFKHGTLLKYFDRQIYLRALKWEQTIKNVAHDKFRDYMY